MTAVAAVDEITVTLTKTGTKTATYSRAEWEKAKKDGILPWLIDPAVSNIEDDITVTEPDGTTFNPYWMP